MLSLKDRTRVKLEEVSWVTYTSSFYFIFIAILSIFLPGTDAEGRWENPISLVPC
jgi:hypothetical protein